MELWRFLTGMLVIEFTSADPEKTLDAIAKNQIPMMHVIQIQELTYQIQISRNNYRKLFKILRQQNINGKIIKKCGFYWHLKTCFHRPVLFTVFGIMVILSFYLPSRIFFVKVEGNHAISDHTIISAAEECGIRFGASRKKVRSEKMKNSLLSAVPELQWAGINTSGCVAVISVRERSQDPPPEQKVVSHLISDRDGYILSTTITSGTPFVFPGESVTVGQLLISGYTDCGICIRASRSEGEILAQTNRQLDVLMPKTYFLPQATDRKYYKVSLLIRKKRINLWKDSSFSATGCGRMYAEYYVSLPGGFQLPFALCIDTYFDRNLQEVIIAKNDAQQQLLQFSESHLLQQMISGQIIQKEHNFNDTGCLYQLSSNYTCTEMIGIERREQIGVMNGKRN